MKLLIFSQYFWPETFIINDLARTLRDQGHEISVATGKPNYPEGQIYPGYQASGLQKEVFDGNIPLYRVPLRPRGKGGARELLLNYLSFVFSGLIHFPRLLPDRSYDVILIFAGSPNVALPALPLKWFKRAHLALWVQDLWPESLEATGFIHNRSILRVVSWVVRLTYACADTLLVQSEAFKKPISQYAAKEKIVYYPNSMSIAENKTKETVQVPMSLKETLQNNFCVVFAGNIGTAQAVHTLVETAVLLKEFPEIKLIIVGSGSKAEWVQQKVDELSLHNVFLPGRFPVSTMPALFQEASCLLVSLKADEIFSFTVPSKVQSYLAAGKPIIAAMNGEGARVVIEAGAGLACPAEDSKALADCIRRLYEMPVEKRQQMGSAGHAYFMKHYEMETQAQRLIEILEQRIVKNKRQPPVKP